MNNWLYICNTNYIICWILKKIFFKILLCERLYYIYLKCHSILSHCFSRERQIKYTLKTYNLFYSLVTWFIYVIELSYLLLFTTRMVFISCILSTIVFYYYCELYKQIISFMAVCFYTTLICMYIHIY